MYSQNTVYLQPGNGDKFSIKYVDKNKIEIKCLQNKWLSRKSIVTLLDEKNKTAENAHWIIVENRPAAKIRPKPKKAL